MKKSNLFMHKEMCNDLFNYCFCDMVIRMNNIKTLLQWDEMFAGGQSSTINCLA